MEVVMNDWDATTYAAKDNLLRVLRREAEAVADRFLNSFFRI
jgi:hypothetical protein